MKKSELYKIVKEALNEVLQEQRAQRLLKPDPDRKQRDPRDPKDPIKPQAVTLTEETNRLFFYTEDCQEIQVDDEWVCGGWHNENSGTQITTFNIPYTDGEITFTNGQGYSCYTPSSNVTVTDFTNWLETTFFTNMSSEAILDYLGYNSANEVSEGCAGCNVISSSIYDQYPSITASNYVETLEGSALADISQCDFPGCPFTTIIVDGEEVSTSNYNPNSNSDTPDLCEYNDPGSGDITGCMETWALNYNSEATIESGGCGSYIVPGCDDDDYLENNTQLADIQTLISNAEPTVADYNTANGSSVEVVVVSANELPENHPLYADWYNEDPDYYCQTAAVLGCTDNDPDTNGGIATNYNSDATVDDGSCEYTEVEAIYGCMDQDACNYSPLATVNQISDTDTTSPCVIPTPGTCEECETDENGNTTGIVIDTDTDEDGICDAQEIPGCTNSSALNFNPDATDDDGSCEFDVKCMNIKATVCNAPQVRGQKKVAYAPISLACVTIDGQTPNMELPATSQFKYPLPSNIVDPAGNTVSPLKRTLAIWQVTSIVPATGYSADQVTDLPFGNCKGPVQVIGDRDPRPLDPSPKEPYFSDPTNPLGDPTSTGYDRVNDPDVEDSRKLREAFEFEFKLTEEQKLRKLIKDTLKQLKK